MVRKEDLPDFSELNYPEDYDLVLYWYKNRFQIKVIPEVTLLWREHTERTSRTSSNYNQKSFFDLKINAFIANELQDNPVILWGNNQKTKLTAEILKASKIPFYRYDLKDYQLLEKHNQAKLLVGVYPSPKERDKLAGYLSSIQMLEGRDWWYL